MSCSPPRPLRSKIVRSVMFSIGRKILAGPIFLLLVPFTLHRVGAEGYGTWSVLGTVVGLSWFLDLGLGASVTKYVAEHRGRNDINKLHSVLNTSCALYLVIASVAMCCLWFFSSAIVSELFQGQGAPKSSTVLSLWPWLIFIVGVDLLTKPFIAVINGFQRMDLTSVLLLGANACNALLTVAFLCTGAKLDGLMWAAAITATLGLAASISVVRVLLPSALPNPFDADSATARSVCSLSLTFLAGSIMTTIQGQAEKLYLARFVGVVPVGWYDMASQAASKIRRLPDILLGPVMAASSELDAAQEHDKISQLHFRAHKYLAATAVPLVAFSLAAAKTLIDVWLGSKFEFIAFPFALLVVGNLFPQIGSPTFFVLVGQRIVRPGVNAALLSSVLNVVCSFIFVQRWGFVGAVWGTVIPMMIGSVYFLWLCSQYMELAVYKTLNGAYLKPTLCSLVGVCAVIVTRFYITRRLPALIVEGVLFGLVYLFGLALTQFFDEFDFAAMEGHVPYIRFARRVILMPQPTNN